MELIDVWAKFIATLPVRISRHWSHYWVLAFMCSIAAVVLMDIIADRYLSSSVSDSDCNSTFPSQNQINLTPYFTLCHQRSTLYTIVAICQIWSLINIFISHGTHTSRNGTQNDLHDATGPYRHSRTPPEICPCAATKNSPNRSPQDILYRERRACWEDGRPSVGLRWTGLQFCVPY
jgi:hypothetical protein